MRYSLEGLTNDDKEILSTFKNKMDDILGKVVWKRKFNPSYIEERFLSVERFVEESLYKNRENHNIKDVVRLLEKAVDLDELYELNKVPLPASGGQRKEGENIISILKRIENLNDIYKIGKIPFELSELKALEPVLKRREAFYVRSLKRELQDCLNNYSFDIRELADSCFKDDKETYNNLKLLSELAGLFSISLNGKGEEDSYKER